MRRVRLAAALGGGLALLLSLPFAVAYARAYGDGGAPHIYRLIIPLLPLLSFARAEIVYQTYGRVFGLVHPLLLAAAWGWFQLHPPQNTLARRTRLLLLWSGGLMGVGVLADYSGTEVNVLFVLELLAIVPLWLAAFLFGRAALADGQMSPLSARLFQLVPLVSLAASLWLGHFPSGPTFGLALAWLVWAARGK